MTGRPNATFTEADWLGIFLVFFLAAILTIIFYIRNSKKIKNLFLAINYLLLWLAFITLILTVSRSAWLGAIFVLLGYLKVVLYYGNTAYIINNDNVGFWKGIANMMKQRWCWREFFGAAVMLIATLVLSIGAVYVFHLTTFQLGNRAVSTGGLQKITIACPVNAKCMLSQKIDSLADLDNCNCRHINLEDIEKEKATGNYISEVYRPDPNVNIRAEIYRDSLQQIKYHPILGIGWGSISKILGTDERGAGLNASNIFLETWLGAGILGFMSLLCLILYILFVMTKRFVHASGNDAGLIFLALGIFAVVIPNFFNSGVFLGFVWTFFGISISLLNEKR